jgi:hypothetical protein
LPEDYRADQGDPRVRDLPPLQIGA